MGIEAMEHRNSWIHRQLLLKGPYTNLLRLTDSEFQCWGSSLKGTRDIEGGTGISGIRPRIGQLVFFQREVLAEAIVPFLSPSPT